MIDHVASTVSLARTMLMDVDPVSVDTTVKSASLRLILETFIGLGGERASPVPNALASPGAQARRETAVRTVAGHLAEHDLTTNPPGGVRRAGR